jgi:hypothetical protein
MKCGRWKNSGWRRVAGKVCNRGLEEAAENGKELSHSAHANGISEQILYYTANRKGLKHGNIKK